MSRRSGGQVCARSATRQRSTCRAPLRTVTIAETRGVTPRPRRGRGRAPRGIRSASPCVSARRAPRLRARAAPGGCAGGGRPRLGKAQEDRSRSRPCAPIRRWEEPVRVDVAIATYRRPKGLARLLGGLERLRCPEGAPDLRVVVIDNDPEGSARAVCEAAEGWLELPLLHRVEKRRGIPQARNAAIGAALERADFLAFIDDDEVPSPLWLAELLRVQAATGADAVAGPCEPVFEDPVPRWVERGGFFERPRHATGARLREAFTHNVLVRTRALAGLDALFDERMALSGGSDVELFRRFAARGHSIVWADEALVFEWVPRSRSNARWILQRAFRVGAQSAFVDRHCGGRPLAAARLLAHGGWCLAKGTALLPVGALRGRAGAVRALRLAAFGAGRLGGLAGLQREEYRAVHGA